MIVYLVKKKILLSFTRSYIFCQSFVDFTKLHTFKDIFDVELKH